MKTATFRPYNTLIAGTNERHPIMDRAGQRVEILSQGYTESRVKFEDGFIDTVHNQELQ